MRKFIYAVILFFVLLMQSTLLTEYRPLGVIPDLLMIVVISSALLNGSKFGALLGISAGILQDLLIGNFGTHLVLKIVVGYLVGIIEGKVFKAKVLVPVLVVFLMTFVHEYLFLLLSEKLIFSISFFDALKTTIFPLALINAIFTLLIYPLLYLVEKKVN